MSHATGFRWCRLTLRLAVYARDGWRCLACGCRLRWRKGRGKWIDRRPEAASLDHVVPRTQGGSHAAENLITLCVGCNSERRDRPIGEWRPELVDAVAIAVSTPVDRRLGVELVRQLDPAFLARRSVRSGTRPAEVPF